MKLLPLATSDILDLVTGWLAQKENYQWLDFGNGRQIVTPALLKIMAQRDTHFLRAYTWDKDDRPIGIVGLNSVDRVFKTGTLWAVAGEKSFSNRGYVSLASSKFLTLVFRDLGLHVVNTWIVDRNPSVRSLERLNFRLTVASTAITRPRLMLFADRFPMRSFGPVPHPAPGARRREGRTADGRTGGRRWCGIAAACR